MATSGTKTFELDIADYIEEAFERCGLEARSGYDLKTATRSLNIMFAEWANRGLNQWTVEQKTIAMVANTGTYNIDATNSTATIDVLDCFIRETQSGTEADIPLSRLSRAEYSNLSTKSTTGKPNQFFIDKGISPTITVWPKPDLSDKYTVVVNALSRIEDAGGAVATAEVPFRFYPCLVAGLAYYISMKKAPDRMPILKQVYEEEFERASSQDEERASYTVSPSLRTYNTA